MLLAGVLFPLRKLQYFFVPILTAGYVKDPKNNHALLVDPEAAEVVKQIFQCFSAA
jgi:hypothetical protein